MSKALLALAVVLVLLPAQVLCQPVIDTSISSIPGGLVEYGYTVTNESNYFLSGFAIFTPIPATDITVLVPSMDWEGMAQAVDSNNTMVTWLIDDWTSGLLYDEYATFAIQVPDTTVSTNSYKAVPFDSNWGWESNGEGVISMAVDSIIVPAPLAIPEPSSFMSLAGLALGYLGMLKYRRL